MVYSGRDMLKRTRRNSEPEAEQGQALLEFAFVAIFLVLVLFGIIDFSRLFFAYATMAQGAREGARYGIVHPGEDDAIEQHARRMVVIVGGEDATVEITYPGIDPDPMGRCTTNPQNTYCPIHVRLSTTLDIWTPIIPSLPLVAQATMHIE
jgi:Flp pilus assembly protein TadG